MAQQYLTDLFYFIQQTSLGKICLVADNAALREVCFGAIPSKFAKAVARKTTLLEQAALQIEEYLQGQRKNFSLPIALQGTDFQQKVWQELLNIPYGETRSYKQIAEKIGCPQGYRAVGMANNKNPIAIIVPCHRVIGQNKKLVGYAGGIDIKEKLLKLEEKYAKS